VGRQRKLIKSALGELDQCVFGCFIEAALFE